MINNEKYFDLADYETITAHDGDNTGFNNKEITENELYSNIIDKYRKELNHAKGILVNITTNKKIDIDKLNKSVKEITNDDCEIIISVDEKDNIANDRLIVSLLITGLNKIDIILRNSFSIMTNKYKKLLKDFYPARDSTGFTEANQSHFYVNSLVKSLDDENCIEWLEFPWSDKSTHIDAMVYSPKYKTIFYIEAKRFSDFDKKLKEISNDIKRVISDNKKFIKDYNIEDIEFQYAIGLADIWYKKDKKSNKKDLIDTWNKKDNQFSQTLNIEDYDDTRLKAFIDIKCVDKENYHLLITYNEISKYRQIEDSFWKSLEEKLSTEINNIKLNFEYDYNEDKRKNNANLQIKITDDTSIFIRRTENTFIKVESSDENIQVKVKKYFNSNELWQYTKYSIDFYNYNDKFFKLKEPKEKETIIIDIVKQINNLIKAIQL